VVQSGVRFSINSNGKRFVLALGVLLLLAEAAASQTLPHASATEPDQRCSGPLGALVPECQSVKASFEIPTVSRPPVEAIPMGRPSGLKPDRAFSQPPVPPQLVEPPPLGISEFQRFVASSIGRALPVFGTSLFDRVPSTFAPLDRVPVTPDYVVAPGDEIVLRIWGQVNLDLEMTVDTAGAVFIPQVGSVNLTGMQFKDLPGFLQSQLGRVYRNFQFNVNMGQLRSIQILVVGQARRPGTYTVSSLSTLVNTIFASGGPSAQGSMRRIQLKRGVQVVTEFDIYDLLLRGDKSKDVRLLSGDLIYFPPAGPQIAVAGSVKTPSVYELKREKTAGELLEIAGGLSSVADGQTATLERIKDHHSRETLELRLDTAGLRAEVQDGDVLHVFTITPRFENAVTVRGNVANPGRFPWRHGMRIRDVIPDKESLLTREYWSKRNLLGFTPQEDMVSAEPQTEAKRKPAKTSIEVYAPEINWSYAVIERRDSRDLKAELVPFHLGKLVLENDAGENLELRPGDVVTIFSQDDIHVPVSQQNRLVRLEGEFHSAGIYAARPGETLGQLVERIGGLTPQAYLFGAELLRESTRRDQQRRIDEFVRNLEREMESSVSKQFDHAVTAEESAALTLNLQNGRRTLERMRSVQATGRIVLNLEPGDKDLSKLMDLPLEANDRFVVPPRPATVNVLGGVYNQNSFIHRAGLTVNDYLRQAGGAMRDADKARVFIIRADGAVVPKQGSGAFSRSFETTQLNPGDSIVMPEGLSRNSFMRGVREWSQVFSQFALGAAAINILR
jgi:polysaccharide export outer membrane protein